MMNVNELDFFSLAEQSVRPIARKAFANFFSEEDLADLVIDVATKAWNSREQLDERRGTPAAWVAVIARNTILDAYHAERRRRALFSSIPLAEDYYLNDDDEKVPVDYVPVATDETDAELIARDTERALRDSLASERDKRLFDGLLQGQERTEMAAAEGVEPSCIYMAVHHLRKRLRDAV